MRSKSACGILVDDDIDRCPLTGDREVGIHIGTSEASIDNQHHFQVSLDMLMKIPWFNHSLWGRIKSAADNAFSRGGGAGFFLKVSTVLCTGNFMRPNS